MYRPRQIGIPAALHDGVLYTEHTPPKNLNKIVFYTWELRATQLLNQDCQYLVLPDICTDIIFDLQATHPNNTAFVMTSGNNAVSINLGRSFHFVGIRFLPGVVPKDMTITGAEHLLQNQLSKTVATDRQVLLHNYIVSLLTQGRITASQLFYRILQRVDHATKVGDLEKISGYSDRHLRRVFIEQTGLSPSNFLKVLRFQHTLDSTAESSYADQSHLIKEYKRITGFTPRIFKATY